MAGAYIHIPFCKSKCFYCDFYSITNWNRELINHFLNAILKEIELKAQFPITKLKTIYFGGGTPSLLEPKHIQTIIDKLKTTFATDKDLEITLEINPDDVTDDYVLKLKNQTEVNRISLGIQSFLNNHLKFLGRRHDANQSISAINLFMHYGFSNISIDLIYGLPIMTLDDLKFNVDKFLEFNLPHLSAYHLTIEEGTVFGKLYKSGKLKPIDEEKSIQQYSFLIDALEKHGYLHYEISNFAKPQFISKHNFSYWTGESYIGLGPAAHSYDQKNRFWNIANVKVYIEKIENNVLPQHSEQLSDKDKFNEYILTRLRTYLGIDVNYLNKTFPEFFKQIKPTINQYIESKHLKFSQNNIILTRKGKFIADSIIADLFI